MHGTFWLQKRPTAGARTALSAKRLRASTGKHKDSAAEMDEDDEDEDEDGANEKAPKSRRRPNTAPTRRAACHGSETPLPTQPRAMPFLMRRSGVFHREP